MDVNNHSCDSNIIEDSLCKCCEEYFAEENKDVCEECGMAMEIGILCIEIDAHLTHDIDYAHRTGKRYILSENSIDAIFGGCELYRKILKKRVVFIPTELSLRFNFDNCENDDVYDLTPD